MRIFLNFESYRFFTRQRSATVLSVFFSIFLCLELIIELHFIFSSYFYFSSKVLFVMINVALSCCFTELHIFKPATSKEGNSEAYVIGLGFNKDLVSHEIIERMINNFKDDSKSMLAFERICETNICYELIFLHFRQRAMFCLRASRQLLKNYLVDPNKKWCHMTHFAFFFNLISGKLFLIGENGDSAVIEASSEADLVWMEGETRCLTNS